MLKINRNPTLSCDPNMQLSWVSNEKFGPNNLLKINKKTFDIQQNHLVILAYDLWVNLGKGAPNYIANLKRNRTTCRSIHLDRLSGYE